MEEGKKKKFPVKWLLVGGVSFLLLVLVAAVLFTPLGGGVLRRAVAPTITLEIVEGPELDEESGIYRILVQAVVTGRPDPTIAFNRNDESGEVEAHMAVIYLAAGASFQLRVSVTNSGGTATATLDLTAPEDTAGNGDDDNGNGNGNGDTGDGNGDDGDDDDDTGSDPPPPANRNPVINSVTVSVPYIFKDEPVTFTVSASDPDGDSLTYHWIFLPRWASSMGDIPAEGSSKQYTPASAEEWTLSVKVRDGRGGEAVFREYYTVHPVVVVMIPPDLVSGGGESGWIKKDDTAYVNWPFIYIGDHDDNKICRGFISFDITGIPAGAEVYKVELRMANPTVLGNPAFMHGGPAQKPRGILIMNDYWGIRDIALGDFNRSLFETDVAATTTNYDVTIVSIRGGSNPAMANSLQDRLDDELPRFQLRVQFLYEVSDDDNVQDGVQWARGDIYLKVWYRMAEAD